MGNPTVDGLIKRCSDLAQSNWEYFGTTFKATTQGTQNIHSPHVTSEKL